MSARRGPDGRREPGLLSLAIHVLTEHVSRPGAPCIGRHEAFDRAAAARSVRGPRGARHRAEIAEAVALCAQCPWRSGCPGRVDPLPPRAHRASGRPVSRAMATAEADR